MPDFNKPHALTDVPFHYCPGCTHGIVHRLVAEVIDEMGIEGDTIGVCPVGCSVMAYDYFNCDMIEASHGRAPAVATGVKRGNPDKFVFTYQGDGDLAAIGTAETVHAATRGENITVIFINNTTYGMTGGQMAPTTLPGQVTQTTPYGRNPDVEGFPVRVCEMLSTLSGVALASQLQIRRISARLRRLSARASNSRRTSRDFPSLKYFPPVPPTGDYLRLRRSNGSRRTWCHIIPWAYSRRVQ